MPTPRWRNKKHTSSWIQTLERHAYPRLCDIPVDRLTKADVLGVLTPISGTRQQTARWVRQRIRAVRRWAMAYAFIETNPAGEAISGALPKVKSHLRALPYREVPDALRTVGSSQGPRSAKLCLALAVLTAARSGEARGAAWSEIDFD